MFRPCILILCSSLLFALNVYAQDTTMTYLKVHFLYGSRPKDAYRETEKPWFGGKLGGHVGVELDSAEIVNFVTNGSFHVFTSKKNRHSRYKIHDEDGFYSILGGTADSTKKAIVYVPIDARQKQLFDSISAAYLAQTPYDYALFGMRCGAATYDILGQLDILPYYSTSKTYKKIFYPKKLRKRLFKKAEENGWKVERVEGTERRKWERD